MKFGSVCSGIEAASLAFKSENILPAWFSEIETFPSDVLSYHFPNIINYGNMNNLPDKILCEEIEAPEILCGGTPCQAFSLAGSQEGLIDERGQLTLKFIDIADSIDYIRISKGLNKSIIMWENVEGVLKDKTNAFGTFIAGLCGLNEPIIVKKWLNSGIIFGKTRNLAWRLLDSKYFGLPQQRKRLYLIATDISLNPELILFEICNHIEAKKIKNLKSLYSHYDKNEFDYNNLTKIIDNQKIEVFREYTDCLYSAYGTKWNGNAAAYNGSLFISQNDRIRRLTTLECERIMGFPDNYTKLFKSSDTSRYKAIGNSWAIPTIEWIVKRISNYDKLTRKNIWVSNIDPIKEGKNYKLFMFQNDLLNISKDILINCSLSSNNIKKGNIFDIIDTNPSEKLYLSDKASEGILRRKSQKNLKMNERLEFILSSNLSINNTFKD